MNSIMEELQNFVDGYGLGISKEKLASKAYWKMEANGHKCYTINGLYLDVDGYDFQFIKSRAQDRWIVKTL